MELSKRKMKVFVGKKEIVIQKVKVFLWRERKGCGKSIKCRLPSFSPVPALFWKDVFLKVSKKKKKKWLEIVKMTKMYITDAVICFPSTWTRGLI